MFCTFMLTITCNIYFGDGKCHLFLFYLYPKTNDYRTFIFECLYVHIRSKLNHYTI